MSQNDITGDEITSKAASDEYRTNYERIFREQAPEHASSEDEHTSSEDEHTSSEGEHASSPAQALPTYREIVKTYKKIGCANSTDFQEPDGSGPWRRCHQSVSGCYEVYCDDKLQIYYDCFCD